MGSDATYESAGHALVDVARRFGATTAFGIVSIHNQPIIDALVDQMRFVPVRHEASAVNAADGYARVSSGLGLAVTSTGTGAGNAAGSMIEALTAGSPVLHVTGQIDSEFLGQGRGVIHETLGQRAMLDAISKSAFTVVDADATHETLLRAAEIAIEAPRGPVSVEIAIDVQYREGRTATESLWTGPTDLDHAALDRAVDMLRAARRPALWVGGGGVEAADEIRRLAEITGAAVFTSNAGRGVIDEAYPQVVGNFAATAGGQALLDEADLLVSVGTHFRSNETRHYRLRLPAPHIQVDIAPEALGRSYPIDLGIRGDAQQVIGHLVDGLGDVDVDAEWLAMTAGARRQVREALRAEIGPYALLCDALREGFAAASPLVRDVTIPASSWGNRLLEVSDPTTNVNARGGGIGQGLAMALGAAIARPEVPTLAVVGDGGIAVHLGELATVAQESPWLVVMLFNDGGYGVLRNLQDAHFGRRAGVDLVTPDFQTLSSSFGLAYRSLRSAGDAAEVVSGAIALGGPVIIEVDCDAFGPMPVPFVPPVPVK